MSDFQLYNHINSLPSNLKKEAEDFIEFLLSKAQSKKKNKKRIFGFAKGLFKMAPDFDTPLEDFKDYM